LIKKRKAKRPEKVGLWDRVNPAGVERVTSQDSFYRKGGASDPAVFLNSLQGIFRTGRIKSAVLSCQWRQNDLIKSDTCV
jgi:hypothetical protein